MVLELGGAGERPDPTRRIELGTDTVQGLVPAGVWQRTLPSSGEALVSCIVSPGFDFADFALAADTEGNPAANPAPDPAAPGPGGAQPA